MPIAAAAAATRYIESRAFSRERWSGDDLAVKVRAQFASLINARPGEISLVESTSRGENLVVNGLGLASAQAAGNVVTDALHFEGSLILYGELQKRGLDVRLVRPRDWRIDPADMERAVDRKTRLVAVSLVSWYNGFQHDLKRVCELAHANGAYVYADIVQAAGNTPIDVRASGVDFCACSSFKWLMGDFGLGFLYVREDLLDAVIRRTEYGYQQADTVMHYLPSDPPSQTPVTWTMQTDARAHFQVGTYGQGALNALAESLGLPAANRRRSDPRPSAASAAAAARRAAAPRLHRDHAAGDDLRHRRVHRAECRAAVRRAAEAGQRLGDARRRSSARVAVAVQRRARRRQAARRLVLEDVFAAGEEPAECGGQAAGRCLGGAAGPPMSDVEIRRAGRLTGGGTRT